MAKSRTPFILFVDEIGDEVAIAQSEGSRVATGYLIMFYVDLQEVSLHPVALEIPLKLTLVQR